MADLSYLFGGRLKARLLQTLVLNPSVAYHLRGLAAAAGVESGNASKTLRALIAAQFVKAVPDARGMRYQANQASAVFEPLHELFLRAGQFMADLKSVAEQLPADQVLVFGSVAKGTERPDSDVDVLVVGTLSGIEAQAAFKPVGRKHRRQINAVTITHESLTAKLADGADFWCDVMQGPVIVLKGEKL